MIEVMQDLPGHVAGFTARGTVSGADYDGVLVPELEARFRVHDSVNILYHFADDFADFEAAALWQSAWEDLNRLGRWQKIAVVTDVDWIRQAASFYGLFRPGRARVFHNEQFGEARDWVAR